MKNHWLAIWCTGLIILLSGSVSHADYLRYTYPDPPFLHQHFFVNAFQIIDTISPNSIATGETKVIKITGRDLQAGATLEIIPSEGLTIASVEVKPTTEIDFQLRVSATAETGLRNLIVYNPDPDGGTFEAWGGIIITNPVNNPGILSIAPASALPGTTLPVTIEGDPSAAAFDSRAVLTFARDITVNTVEVVSGLKIRASIAVASGATGGPVIFTVKNPDGGVGSSYFTIEHTKEGFAFDRVWPTIPGYQGKYPEKSFIDPFILILKGDYTNLTFSFSSENITWESYTIGTFESSPGVVGSYIRIRKLTIGDFGIGTDDTKVTEVTITVTNRDDNTTEAYTATYPIYIVGQSAFLGVVSNAAPVYPTAMQAFDLKDTSEIKIKGVLNKPVQNVKAFMVGPQGFEPELQLDLGGPYSPSGSSSVQGFSASGPYSFSVKPMGLTGKGVFTYTAPLRGIRANGIYKCHFLFQVDANNVERVSVPVIVRNSQ